MSAFTPSTSTTQGDTGIETTEVIIPEQTVAIPLFLKKLWKMVNDSSAENIIRWNSTGDGFIIDDQIKFVTELLPQYFKHNKLSSFIRQLNFYDFHKVANIDRHEMEFAHPCFLKDVPQTLSFITRKVPVMKSRSNQGVQQESVTELLNGVKELKTKQSMVDNELKTLKQENATLWNEINSLRVKYTKQTKIINKLIHFLISYMHSHQNSFGKTNITVSRKIDQKHLRNTPQLLQIDFCKTPNVTNKISNSKIAGSSRTAAITAPTGIKNTTQNYNIPTKMLKNLSGTMSKTKVTSNKYPLASYPLDKNVTEVDAESYNVASPEHQEAVPTDKSPYPIEEIVTEVDPNLEETSVYTVKFPKNELTSNQVESGIQSSTIANSTNSNVIFRKQKVKQLNSKLPETLLQHKGNLLHGKRKLMDNLQPKIISNAKILKTSPKGGGVLVVPQKTQRSKTDSFDQKNLTTTGNQLMPDSSLQNDSEQNSVSGTGLLEKLITEISNSGETPNLSGLLSDLPADPLDLGLRLEREPPENLFQNQTDPFLIQTQPTPQRDLHSVNDSRDLLSTVSPNMMDPGEKILLQNSPEEILSSLSTDSELAGYDNEILLENYPEEMLSTLSSIKESPSKELQKFNIIENPKGNLGLYLDNTQIQLDNIQDILNDLNSENLLDLLSCFNVENEDHSLEQKNITLGQNELESDSVYQ